LNYYTHTVQETAERFSICPRSVTNLRDRFGLPRREQERDTHKLSAKQLEIITGSLLGDGHLTTPTKATFNSYFQEEHCVAQEEYCRWKYEQLKPFSRRFFTNKQRASCVLRTLCHPVLTALEQKWYKRDENGNRMLNKNGKKIKVLPPDLILTPLSLAILYLDDGTNIPKRRSVTIATHCFNYSNVEVLCNLIKSLGIDNCKTVKGPMIYIGASSYLKFIDLVGEYVFSDCMKYKIDLKEYMSSKRPGHFFGKTKGG
jgi:hypothetical protein